MDKFRIAELAARTGFSPAALRYYEQLGLLAAPERSSAGYRLYGQRDVERALFVARAKRLGLSLEEIHSLVDVWVGGECTVTRRQLRGVVETKIDATRRQLEDCATFLQQLQAVHDRLEHQDGPETAGCGCAPELPRVETLQIETVRRDQQLTTSSPA
ncbi:MAG: MerR family transcriptional regulator [Mycobacteriales bacterium]